MNKNINLCELLEGHEGETFYSPICGDIIFVEINFKLENCIATNRFNLSQSGKWNKEGEIMIFPSKDQRDWNKWAEEHKHKIPKTWEELEDKGYSVVYNVDTRLTHDGLNPVEKSALALLKIYQLIEVGYGGNVTTDEWCGHAKTPIYVVLPEYNQEDFLGIYVVDDLADKGIHHIAFHTKEQAIEFLSYPENIQLLKDYYMI